MDFADIFVFNPHSITAFRGRGADGFRPLPDVTAVDGVWARDIVMGERSLAGLFLAEVPNGRVRFRSSVTTDSVGPTTALRGAFTAVDGKVWAPRLQLTATDSGWGVQDTFFAFDGGTESVYSAPVSFPGGTHKLNFYSVDEAGNVEGSHEVTISVDTAPPTTTSNAKSSYLQAATISLAATDDALSGVATTEWRLDSGSWMTGTTVSVTSAGPHRLEYRSTDVVGNVESIKSRTFTVIHPTAVALTSKSNPSLGYGATFIVKGTLKDGSNGLVGKQAILQSAPPGGSFKDTSLRVTTGAGGAFSFSVKPGVKTYYRVRFAGSTGYSASGPPTSVYAKPKVRLTRSTSWSTLRVNRIYYAKGFIKPKHAKSDTNKIKIRAYKKASNGKYRYVKSFTASYSYYSSTKSRYTAAVRLPSKGYWKLRAYHAGDSKNASTYGSADYVRVR